MNLVLFAQAAANDAAGVGSFLGGLLAFGAAFWIVGLVLSVFWLWALVDVVTSNMPSTEKILWFLVVFFLHILGAIIYAAVGRTGHAGTSGRPMGA